MTATSTDRPFPGRAGLLGGAALSLGVAVVLFTRFGLDGTLSRDEGIYSYGGQQMARGVPPYDSVFDPKAPLATMIAGVAAALGRLVHHNELTMIRLAYFACACLSVLAVYALAVQLFRSVTAGLTAAVVLASSWPFAVDALSGPDAKTPGVLFALLSMWLAVRRQWLWAAFAGGLAFLVWQPLAVYPFVVVVLAVLAPGAGRWRRGGLALLGAALPVLATCVYFVLTGAVGVLVEAALVFPLTGVRRSTETTGHRLARIVHVVDGSYGYPAVFWIGCGALLVLAVLDVLRRRGDGWRALLAPLPAVVAVTFLIEVGYAATDFQGYPDLYPLLAYPALGLAGCVALAVGLVRASVARVAVIVAVAAALAVLTTAAAVTFTRSPAHDHGLRRQLAAACAVHRLALPGTRVWSLGDPSALVVTRLTNPDRFIYLGSGADVWKVEHSSGGFAGWTDQIRRVAPSVIVFQGWSGRYRAPMAAWLHQQGYRSRFAGRWHVLLTPQARQAARGHVRLTRRPTEFAHGPGGRRLPASGCE